MSQNNEKRKRCVNCKALSSFGIDDPVEGFRCYICDRDAEIKKNKKYKLEEFIRNKVPLLSIIISSVLSSIAIIVSFLAYYK